MEEDTPRGEWSRTIVILDDDARRLSLSEDSSQSTVFEASVVIASSQRINRLLLPLLFTESIIVRSIPIC